MAFNRVVHCDNAFKAVPEFIKQLAVTVNRDEFITLGLKIVYPIEISILVIRIAGGYEQYGVVSVDNTLDSPDRRMVSVNSWRCAAKI